MVEVEIKPASAATTAYERRLQAEWLLLEQLAALNPARLHQPAWPEDATFHVTLRKTPALPLGSGPLQDRHDLRIQYPRFFPAVPLELYLGQPVLHPNVHPLTGFVCLWDRHSVTNTVEHAIHKTAAMLGWKLLNPDPRHVMQPGAPQAFASAPSAMRTALAATGLRGIAHDFEPGGFARTDEPRRRRLS